MNVGEYTAPIQTPAGFLILNIVIKRIEQNFDINKELSLRIKNLQNQQLNQYSNIYFNKIKKDIKISENKAIIIVCGEPKSIFLEIF